MFNLSLVDVRKLLITAVGAGLVIIIGLLSSESVMIPVVLGGFAVVILVMFNYQASLYFLMAASTLNGFSGVVSSPLMRPENASIFIGVAAFLIYLITKRSKLFISFEIFAFIAFIAFTYWTSLNFSPLVDVSKRGIFQLVIAFLGYVVIIQSQSLEKGKIINLIKGYALIATAQSVFGLISFALYELQNIDIGGLMFGQQGDSVSLKGTLLEANLFGSFVGVGLILTITLLTNNLVVRRKLWVAASIIMLLGLLLSWTRSAWLGFIIGMIVLAVYTYRKMFTSANFIRFVLIGTLIIGPLIFIVQSQFDSASGKSGLFVSKFTSLFEADSGTGLYRVNQFERAWDDLKGHELLGTGYFSIKKFGEKEWISNLFLFVYHDTGIIGFFLFMLILFSVIFKAVTALRHSKDVEYRVILSGLLSGLALYMFSFNFTPGHTLSMFWIYLGLIVVLAKKSMKEPS